ncbi:MAG: hypothetical protein KBS83_03860, partial [Lachnospiraceae bacterium]|nr:hypothetical protein [Candidatus Equihabitans merdae]
NLEAGAKCLKVTASAMTLEYAGNNKRTRLYRQEPFVVDCDGMPYLQYIMVMEDGWRKRHVKVIKVAGAGSPQ